LAWHLHRFVAGFARIQIRSSAHDRLNSCESSYRQWERMTSKHVPSGGPPSSGLLNLPKKHRKPKSPTRRSATEVRVRQVPEDTVWEFLHPRCALERADDIEEVETILTAGENEIAMDELRWLLSGCSDFIQGHRMLGELALASGDLQLARGHFGFAFHAGAKAWKKAGKPAPLPYGRAANRDFFESGKGLAHCLIGAEKREMAEEVVHVLLQCDPTDPLGVKKLLARRGS
jgi:hypothetical protein